MRKIGYIKFIARAAILAIFAPLLWILTSLAINYPSDFRLYTAAFIVLVIVTVILFSVADRIIDNAIPKKKN